MLVEKETLSDNVQKCQYLSVRAVMTADCSRLLVRHSLQTRALPFVSLTAGGEQTRT